jgi:hypothetical protein
VHAPEAAEPAAEALDAAVGLGPGALDLALTLAHRVLGMF